MEGKLERRDIIKDYSDYGFQTYAPRSQIGQIPGANANRNVVKSHFLRTYEGLLLSTDGVFLMIIQDTVEFIVNDFLVILFEKYLLNANNIFILMSFFVQYILIFFILFLNILSIKINDPILLLKSDQGVY